MEARAQHANITDLQAKADAAFIGIRRVCEISGFSKATIARKMNPKDDNGKPLPPQFPRPVIQEGNCVRWDLAEVLQWRAEQFKKREARAQPPYGAAMAPA